MAQILNTAVIENSLRLEAQQSCGKLSWLEESYGNPGPFWASLKSAFEARVTAPGASALFNSYNFFHDIIVCNLNNTAPAFSWYDGRSVFNSISYRELGDMASAKASQWVRAGLKPGQSLCLIRPVGPELITEMLAALKIGCLISFLPPQGKGFLQRRLDALGPDFIMIDPLHLPLAPAWAEKLLPEKELPGNMNPERERSYAYPSGQAVFQTFNPCGQDNLVPAEITSDAAYLNALRDGTVSLGLGPGQVYTAPGFHYLETYPFLLLAGLLCGATYLHLSPKVIADHPELVINKQIKAFGVSKKVRDILLDRAQEIGGAWESWFRNPAESIDLEQWHYFVRNLKLEKAYAFNLRWNAALGGCSLFSIRRKGMAHMNVMPVPGSAWCLGDLSDGTVESPADIGMYALSAPGAAEDDKKESSDIILKNRHEWVFAGLNAPHREGRFVPFPEILDSLRTVESRYGCFFSFVHVPLIDAGSGHRFILLVFRGAKTNMDEVRLSSEIRSTISSEMGDEFQPDRIQFFSLYPRFLEGKETDHEWCRKQYLSGAFFRKERGGFFRCITRLRGSIMALEMANAQG